MCGCGDGGYLCRNGASSVIKLKWPLQCSHAMNNDAHWSNHDDLWQSSHCSSGLSWRVTMVRPPGYVIGNDLFRCKIKRFHHVLCIIVHG